MMKITLKDLRNVIKDAKLSDEIDIRNCADGYELTDGGGTHSATTIYELSQLVAESIASYNF